MPAALELDEASQLQQLEELTRVKLRFGRNERIYSAGTRSHALYVVRSGGVKIVVNTADGEEQIVAFGFPGDVIGHDAIDGGTHTNTAVALEFTSLCQLPMAMVAEFAGLAPRLNAYLFGVLARSLRDDRQLLTLLARRTAEQRVASFVIAIADRQRWRSLSGRRFRLPMSRKDFGNHLGLAIETVSRVFARLNTSGVVETRGREVTILDPQRLQAVSALDAHSEPATVQVARDARLPRAPRASCAR